MVGDGRAGSLMIHAQHNNKNAFKALIAAEYVGVIVQTTPDFKMGVSNKTPEFSQLTPIGKVPVMETPEGPIFESNAIARYVARLKDVGLFGWSAYEEGLVEQWIDFASFEIDNNAMRWIGPRLGMGAFDKEVDALVLYNLKRAMTTLNGYLSSRTYLVGHAVTLADIVLVCNLTLPLHLALTKEFTAEYPHLMRYFWTVINQPQFKKIMGDGFAQATKPLGAPPPKIENKIENKTENKTKNENKNKNEKSSTSRPEGHRKGKKEGGKKAEPTPKAKVEVPPPKPAPQPEELDVEEEEAPVKKSKNALDLLPPSPMILDDWKRLYSNTKAKDFHLAINGFWEMFDLEGYSLWFCDYKHNEENQVTFVTMNKVGGFFQRMDLARKYSFSKMCILGDSPPYKIKGVWLFRGPDVPQMVIEECYDAELYEWTKVDITDPAQKALVNAYFEEPEEINGDVLLEAKCFK